MNKSESTILKGVAIVFMLLTHLFGTIELSNLCTNFFYIGDVPLINYLVGITGSCVPIYLFISGYGLFTSFAEGKKKTWTRILSLWLNYTIILFVFVAIGHFVLPNKYPDSLSTFLLNLSSWSMSYNAEWWFLFPYFVLVLCSRLIFKVILKYNSWFIFSIFISIGFAYVAITHLFENWLNIHLWANRPLVTLFCTMSFATGALFAKENIFNKIRSYLPSTYFITILIAVVIMAMFIPREFLTFLPNSFTRFGFGILFIISFVMLKRPVIIDNFFLFLGAHSTNIWLVHTFFCKYLFRNFIYSFKYPVVIFVVLLLCSLLSSYAINLMYKPLYNLIIKNQK
jgi:surface polysaccharide O-acyltransferase-like enzyme